MYEAAWQVQEDAADELRQYAGAAEDPEAAVHAQAEVIQSRVTGDDVPSQIAHEAITRAEEQVISETPAQRDLQIQRTRVIRADRHVKEVEAQGEAAEPGALESAQADYEAEAGAFQDRVLTEMSTEAAQAHLDKIDELAQGARGQIGMSEFAEMRQAARTQLAAAANGEVPTDFSDADIQAALDTMNTRYGGLGLEDYFTSLRDGVVLNRDRMRAYESAPVDLVNEVAEVHRDNAKAAADSHQGGDNAAALEQAEQQLTDVHTGSIPTDFTDAELQRAIDNLNARNPALELNDVYTSIGDQLKEGRDTAALVDDTHERIQDRVDAYLSGNDQVCYADAPYELQQSDPVTAAFIAEIGGPVYTGSSGLSAEEQSIAEADPIMFALMQDAGVGLEQSDVHTLVVTIDGEQVELNAEQRDLAARRRRVRPRRCRARRSRQGAVQQRDPGGDPGDHAGAPRLRLRPRDGPGCARQGSGRAQPARHQYRRGVLARRSHPALG